MALQVFMSPPWGGPEYNGMRVFDLRRLGDEIVRLWCEGLCNVNVADGLRRWHYQNLTHEVICFFLPQDFRRALRLAQRVAPRVAAFL